MAALRFTPDGELSARGRAGDRPRRTHRVEHRTRRIAADQIGMRHRRAESRIVGCDDDIAFADRLFQARRRSEAHTSELQSLMRISYAVFCLKKKIQSIKISHTSR